MFSVASYLATHVRIPLGIAVSCDWMGALYRPVAADARNAILSSIDQLILVVLDFVFLMHFI